MQTNNVYLDDKNSIISVTYNLNRTVTGADTMDNINSMRKNKADTILSVENENAFNSLIKAGIYKSLFNEGYLTINNITKLMQIDNADSEGKRK